MSGCKLHPGTVNNSGYAKVSVSGRTVYAHRHAYELRHGAIPAGLLVLHTCDNRRCVNPDHLYAGTQRQNVADMDRRGRRRKRWGLVKAEILKLLAEGWNDRQIAPMVGCDQNYVGKIRRLVNV